MTSNQKGIIRRYRAGDKSAFTEFFGATAEGLYGFVGRKVQDADTLDILQETYASFAEAVMRKDYDPNRTPRGFLWAIARNKLIDHYRRIGRSVPIDEDASDDLPTLMDQSLGGVEQTDAVSEILRSLPSTESELLRLKYIDELTLEEIAELEGVGTSTIYRRIETVLGRLRAAARTRGKEVR